MAVRSFRELIAWQKSMELVEAVYCATKEFPQREVYGLASQLRRAAVSIPSNIAEGSGRETTADFLRFLAISRGSLCEVETQIELSVRLGFIQVDQAQGLFSLVNEVFRILHGLIRSLRDH